MNPIAGETTNEGSTVGLGPVTFTDPGTLDTHTATVNWGDGTSTEAATVTESPFGPPGSTSGQTGSIADTHVYATFGTYTVTVTVTDNGGLSSTQTFQIVVGNVGPTLNPIAGETTNEGSTVGLGPVTFSDPGTLDTHTATVNWGDGTTTEAATVTESPFGPPGSTSGQTGSIADTHVYATFGTYTVTVTVTDNGGLSSTQTFQIVVGNVAPTLNPIAGESTNEGSTVGLGPVTFSDPGTLDTHTATVNWGDGTTTEAATVTESPFGPPGSTSGQTGSIADTHVYATFGTYTVTVTVTDNGGLSSTQTFQIVVGNVAPTLQPIGSQSVDEGSLFNLPGVTFTDPGTLDTHTATVNWGDGSATQVAMVTESPFGPPGSTSGLTGSISGSHTYGEPGTYTVTLTVTDNGGLTDIRSFTLVVNDVAPSFTTTIAPGSLNEGSVLTTSTIGFSSPTFAVPALNYTPTFTYSINWGDGSAIQTGSAPVTQAGAVGVLTEGSFNLSHLYGVTGVYQATITIIDPQGGASSQTFQVTAHDVTPTLTLTQFTELNVVSMTLSTGQTFDPGTNPLTVTITWGDNSTTVFAVPGANINGLNLSHIYAGPPDPLDPAAPIPVGVTVSEIIGSAVTLHFLVQVPGTGVAIVTFLPEPTAPPIPPPLTVLTESSSFYMAPPPPVTAPVDLTPARGETVGAAEDQVVMRTVFPTGREGDDILLPPTVLDNLPGYLKRLPDGHYRIYFVQGDTHRERLIIDVNVPQGARSMPATIPRGRKTVRRVPGSNRWAVLSASRSSCPAQALRKLAAGGKLGGRDFAAGGAQRAGVAGRAAAGCRAEQRWAKQRRAEQPGRNGEARAGAQGSRTDEAASYRPLNGHVALAALAWAGAGGRHGAKRLKQRPRLGRHVQGGPAGTAVAERFRGPGLGFPGLIEVDFGSNIECHRTRRPRQGPWMNHRHAELSGL